ncbi:uncharacterized protein LOC101852583 [Aplysia californica]|uniref:Uncharacterized protein LOC101852583 n=1 Tax=Aplysia californica TaxID=6500 RepID=A0ABM1W316_APLCA|nr:uncharacterized protein LOC101852583 [Aplysia californica]
MSAASLSDVYSQSPSGSISDHMSDRASPATLTGSGHVSQSVPTNIPDWRGKDSGPSDRKFSSYSQESVSSHNSVPEEEMSSEPVPEAHPFDFVAPSLAPRRQSTPVLAGNSSDNSNNNSRAVKKSPVSQRKTSALSVAETYSLSPSPPTSAPTPTSALIGSRRSEDSTASDSSSLVEVDVENNAEDSSPKLCHAVPQTQDPGHCPYIGDHMSHAASSPRAGESDRAGVLSPCYVTSSRDSGRVVDSRSASDVSTESEETPQQSPPPPQQSPPPPPQQSPPQSPAPAPEVSDPPSGTTTPPPGSEGKDDNFSGPRLVHTIVDEPVQEIVSDTMVSQEMATAPRNAPSVTRESPGIMGDSATAVVDQDGGVGTTAATDSLSAPQDSSSSSSSSSSSFSSTSSSAPGPPAEISTTTPSTTTATTTTASTTASTTTASATATTTATVEMVEEGLTSPPTQKRRQISVYSAVDLPTAADPDFVLWLEEQLLTPPPSSPTSPSPWSESGVSRRGVSRSSVIDVLWCYAEQLSDPAAVFPCCVVLSSHTVFIERLVSLPSSFPSVPQLEPCSILPVGNIHQIIVGPCHAYMRVEEAFVGRAGTYTLYALQPTAVRTFLHKLLEVNSGMDVRNSPDCLDLSVQSDLLKVIAGREEKDGGVASDRIAVASLIRPKGFHNFTFLVLSENGVYCLDRSLTSWPPASFQANPDSSIPFKVIHEFAIMDMISDIKLRPPARPTTQTEPGVAAETAAYGALESGMTFTHYQLDLEVYLAPGKDDLLTTVETLPKRRCENVCYHFYSAASRDLFLDRLTNLRVEQAHRMSPSVRQEPEGGNEQLPLRDAAPPPSSPPLSDTSSDKSHSFRGNSSPPARLPGHRDSGYKSPDDLSAVSRLVSGSGRKSGSETKEILARYVDSGVLERDRSPAIAVQTAGVVGVSSALKSADLASVSASVVSDRSLGAGSLTDTDLCPDLTLPQRVAGDSSSYHSSSLKDDLSVSPMSNFSRASISPPVPHDDTHATHHHSQRATHARPSRHVCQDNVAKADSLPSSYEWRKYYFKSPPLDGEVESCVAVASAVPGLVGVRDSRTILEDVESSSEMENGHKYDVSLTTEDSCVVETELEGYLKRCVKSYDLIHPLPTRLKPLGLMSGRELRKFFHSVVATKHVSEAGKHGSEGGEGLAEDLHHVLWAYVVPYSNPRQEIPTLVMVSTRAVYLVSDTSVQTPGHSRPSWMTHARNQSDSAFAWKTAALAGGSGGSSRPMVKPYFVFRFEDLEQVNVGLFDQCVRLTGSNENCVFTVATRDRVVTETFLHKLKHVLSLTVSSPMAERSRQEVEQDFYRDSSQRTKSTIDGHVYTHPSQVEFVYPGEDTIQDMLYLVSERVGGGPRRSGSSSVSEPTSLWFYLLCYLLPSDDAAPTSERTRPRSVIVTATHLCLAEEDLVTYPLPDFVRGLPENPCQEIVECRRIDSLKRVQLSHANPHTVSLVFADEVDGIVVDVSMEHFAHARPGGKGRLKPSPEVAIRLFIQSSREKDKMVAVIERLWKQQVAQVGRILDVSKV